MPQDMSEEEFLQRGGILEQCSCEEHGNYVSYKLPIAFGNSKTYLGSGCPDCVQTWEDKFEGKIRAMERQEKEERLMKLGLEKKYFPCTFQNYKAETPSQKDALRASKDITTGDLKRLVLLGGNGLGKTHLGAAIVKHCYGKILSAYEMYAIYRSCMSGQKNELQYIKELSNYPVLVIDEFGRTKGSEAEFNFLSVIIDKRYAKDLPTVILSNAILKKDCVFGSKNCANCQRKTCLESKISADMFSRLCENSEIITIEGEDYRQKRS